MARPIVLIIRDGWGANPHPEWNHANAVHLARKPVDDRLMAAYPHVQIRTCGNDVGLPDGVMGNSEVGHQNIGAGRIVEQELMRITGRIRDGSFFANPVLVEAFERARKSNGAVHILGLCSNGRVHSDLEHLYGLLELSKRLNFPGQRVFVHAITDGRDTPPNSGLAFVRDVETRCKESGVNPVASVIGRYYAMDRDHRWERTQKAYRMLVDGEARTFTSATQAIEHYYANPSEESRRGDEFIVPSVIPSHGEAAKICDGDSVIFFNYRGDRPRQLTKAFTLDLFPYPEPAKDKAIIGFNRGKELDLYFVTMTAYEEGLPVRVAYDKPAKMTDILGAYLSDQGLRQFRTAETEKYAHVTFFFNDYRDDPFPGEERLLIPSPRDVSTYDHKPEMSAYEVTAALLERLACGSQTLPPYQGGLRATEEGARRGGQLDDFILVNFANPDMVGHTGNLQAAIRAVETVDECVGKIVDAVLARGGGLIVTADHGNCEQMIDPATGGPHTAHTTYDVELIFVDERHRGRRLRSGGRLADIAPTVLELMGLPKPDSMTGTSLIASESPASAQQH